jgi:hypothetical protein
VSVLRVDRHRPRSPERARTLSVDALLQRLRAALREVRLSGSPFDLRPRVARGRDGGYRRSRGGDGDYFDWERVADRTERFVGFGGDAEGLALSSADPNRFSLPSDGPVTVDEGTCVSTLSRADPIDVSFDDYAAGEVEPVTPETDAAVQVGVSGAGEDTVREVVVTDVRVRRA